MKIIKKKFIKVEVDFEVQCLLSTSSSDGAANLFLVLSSNITIVGLRFNR